MANSFVNKRFSVTPSTRLSYGMTYLAAGATLLSGTPTYKINDTTTIDRVPPAMEPSHATEAVMSYDERLIDAKFEAVEARTETKFAQLLGKMDILAEKISGVSADIAKLDTAIGKVEAKTTNTRVIVITTIIGAFLATAGIVYTVASYSIAIADFVKGK